ncbi:condensation domain-containing protein [Candidatus Mycobacterium wuenschmannii]|uniref:Condensation domain-containing protein n=1 Tax=Candidatus Mycobacterium wuenschmannii TaxID=3027808 RepID=A0ABY8W4M2_9MYCO|nr:condensation domain-containing protein [Candidatus Mycobacterium wuenschmannii]WIM88719.1 condensation domain-containing protein [Candidatus Mycobacterium wuenschmannii]
MYDWVPDPGSVVSWGPTPATLTKAAEAPANPTPPSYMQAEHLRSWLDFAAKGVDMSRLCIATWEIPGQCDVRAMTHVINTHLKRHDTFHSWFEYSGEDIVRRTIDNPAAIKFVPIKHGEMTPDELQSLAMATPDPLQWDSFRFMIIQHPNHFTFCISIDHINIDATYPSVLLPEIQMQYAALAGGGAPLVLPKAGSYLDYCDRQHQYLSSLTVESPEVKAWIEYFESNSGTLPDCPVSLGDGSGICDLMSLTLLDQKQTAAFESVCVSAGARFSGGVFACAALTERELNGVDTYYGYVVTDIRSTPEDFMTSGWITGFVPITVPISPRSFDETVRAAQSSFDSGRELAKVPFARVLDLAPWLQRPDRRVPLMFHIDLGIPPFSALVTEKLEGLNARIFQDGGAPAQFDIRVTRLENETRAVVLFPDNPVARESVTQFLTLLKSVYVRVAERRYSAEPIREVALTQSA